MVTELLGFFTRLPSGKISLENTARHSYLLPLLGIFIGIIVGTFSFLVFQFVDRFFATILTLICLYLITGLNHIDGLADFADGLYVCGDKELKVKAMKDTQTGIAGIIITIFTILLLIYGFYSINGDIVKIIVAEVSSKSAMILAMYFGKPMKNGTGSFFIKNLNRKAVPFSILFSFLFSYILLEYIGLIAIVASTASSLIIVKIAHNNFDSINGDVIGAVNELSRVVSIAVLVFLI